MSVCETRVTTSHQPVARQSATDLHCGVGLPYVHALISIQYDELACVDYRFCSNERCSGDDVSEWLSRTVRVYVSETHMGIERLCGLRHSIGAPYITDRCANGIAKCAYGRRGLDSNLHRLWIDVRGANGQFEG